MTRCNCEGKHRRWCPNRRTPIPVAVQNVDLATVDVPAGRSPKVAAEWVQSKIDKAWRRHDCGNNVIAEVHGSEWAIGGYCIDGPYKIAMSPSDAKLRADQNLSNLGWQLLGGGE